MCLTLHFVEGPFCAGRCDRDIERFRFGVISGRHDVADSAKVWAELELDTRLADHPGTVCHGTGVLVHIDKRLKAEVVGIDEFARGGIDLPKDTELSHLEDGPSTSVVDQDALEDLVKIV